MGCFLDNVGVMMRNKGLAMCVMVYAIEKKHLGLFQWTSDLRDIAAMIIPH